MQSITSNCSGAKAPILAIHGSAASGKQWKSLRLQLGEERKLLAPDLPGYGKNNPPNDSDASGLAGRAQPMLKLLRQLKHPVHVVAHSFGAAIALELLRTSPQLVRSLWLYEPIVPSLLQHSGTDKDLALLSDLALLANMLDRASGQVAMSAFVDFWHGDVRWAQLPDDRRAILADQASTVLRDFREAFSRSVPVAELKRYTAPVHIAVGEHTRQHATRMASLLCALLPNSQTLRCADMGHMGPCTHSAQVNDSILDWIQRVEENRPGSALSAPERTAAIA
ncbi:MAG: alpha/beta hydrolase [Pseudomonadota bacterium]